MAAIKIWKIARVLLAIGKIAVPVLEEVFKIDINQDGKIGTKSKK